MTQGRRVLGVLGGPVSSEWVACMLFDYVAETLQPGRLGTVWSQFPLQPLTPGVLTPFSYSVLAELASRAWFVYYDRLGFDPTPRSKLVRRHKGRVYFNLSLSAQLEAEHAGLEPLVLQINQQRQPLAKWEKASFLASFKLGRAQKKIDELWGESARQISATTDKARAWYLKTQEARWGQAEVLQIMEEIERVGVESMVAFLAARQNLLRHYAHLLADLEGQATTAQGLLLINNALSNTQGMVETAIGDALLDTAKAMREPAQLAWLKAGDYTGWRTSLPNKEASERVATFMTTYGQRAIHEGEMANPRWSEDAAGLMWGILAYLESTNKGAAKASHNGHAQTLLEKLPSSARKQGEQTLQKIGELHKLQSNALHALAYIWAGTRSWALAAAREAMVDKRLLSEHEVFFFELEEIKQMMTGEWNISSRDEIRATAAQRESEHTAAQQEIAPDLLVGDDEAYITHRGLAGVAGKASGLFYPVQSLQQNGNSGAVVGSELLDSGYALTLPLATAFVAASGTPLDPIVVAMRAWQQPVIVGMGQGYRALVEGAQTTVDANPDVLRVSQ